MVPDRICRLLTAYVDGELDSPQRKALVRVLGRSSKARGLLRDLQKDAERLHGLPTQTLGPDFSEQLLDTITSHKTASARRSALTVRSDVPAWLGLASAAAAVLLVVGFRLYLSFVTVDRPQQDQLLARRIPPSTGSSISLPDMGPELNTSSSPEPSARERLGLPAPVNEAKTPSSTVIASSTGGTAQADANPPPLQGSPLLKDSNPHFKDPETPIGLVFTLRDLDLEKRKQLHQELQKGSAHSMYLRCTNTVAGIERLQTAFKSQGIEFVIDQDAQAILKLGMGKNAPLALYLEEVTAAEMVAVLQQVSSEDRNPENKRVGAGRLESLIVNGVAREDQPKLWRSLGIDPARLESPKPKDPAGVDIRKPLSVTTEEEIIRSLKANAGARLESARPAMKNPNRQALLVAFTPGRPRPPSTELKRFLDNRREHSPGNLQVFLFLSSKKG